MAIVQAHSRVWKSLVRGRTIILGGVLALALGAAPALSQEIRLQPFDSKSSNLLLKPDESTGSNPPPGMVQFKPLNPSTLITPYTAQPIQKPQRSRSVSVINEGDILSNTLNGPSPPEGVEMVYQKPVGQYATVKTADDIRLMKVLMYATADAKAEAVKKVLASPSKFTPPVLLALVPNLMHQGAKDDAVFWYLAGYLRARYDGNRCTDSSARAGFGVLFATFAPVQYIREKPSTLEPLLQKVIDWDKKTPYGYDHRWINMHGLSAFSSAADSDPLSLPQSEWPIIQARTRKEFLEEFTKIIAQLKAGPDGDKTGQSASTQAKIVPPIVQAAMDNKIDAVKSELNKGASVSATDQNGETPLYWAAANVNLPMIELLLSKGASVKAITTDGTTPLHEATMYGAFFSIKRDAERRGHKLPKTASETDAPPPTVAELESKVLPCVNALLKAGADPNASRQGSTPLLIAASHEYTNVCKTLLAHGASAKARNSYGESALHMAAKHGDLELCKALVAAGAEVDVSSHGMTPLLHAADGPYPELVEFFLSKGANAKSRNTSGETALQLAINASSHNKDPLVPQKVVNVATLLLKAGTDPNQGTQFVGTPLPTAARQENLPLVRLLVEKGANVNVAESISNWTALHYAASKGNLEMVQFLLNNGADVQALSTDKKSPLAVVAGAHADEIKSEFIKRGAK
jgi:ankyrin repeat protein